MGKSHPRFGRLIPKANVIGLPRWLSKEALNPDAGRRWSWSRQRVEKKPPESAVGEEQRSRAHIRAEGMVALARLASEDGKDAEQEDGVVEERGDRSDAVSAGQTLEPLHALALSWSYH